MAYERINWQNESSGNTPLSAENLNHMEDGIAEAIQRIDNHLAIYVNGVAYPISMISQQTVQGVEGFLITIDLGNNQETTYFVADGIGLNTVKAAIEAQIPDVVIVDSSLSGTSTNPVQNSAIVTALTGKLNAPAGGTAGQVLQKTADGARWADVGTPSQEQISEAVSTYISEHPESLSPLSPAVKSALLDCFANVAWKDVDGDDYYDALNAALNASVLLSITAVYTQTGTVYDSASLDSLKPDLVITAYYDNGTSAVISSGYTLSGTLEVGTSTITATYEEKTATFNVTVTATPSYITDGLVHRWDGIDNTGSGHDSSVTTWSDLVGNITLTKVAGGSWVDNGLHFEPTAGTNEYYWKDSTETSVYTQNMTVEVCITPTASPTVADWADNKSAVIVNVASAGSNQLRRMMLSKGDISVGGYTNGSNQFATTGFATLLGIRHIACTYTAAAGTNTVFVNGVQKTMNANHTFGENTRDYVFVGCSLGNSKYPYLGHIHSIRVYNRVLTAEEVAQNYAVDVIRFGLE